VSAAASTPLLAHGPRLSCGPGSTPAREAAWHVWNGSCSMHGTRGNMEPRGLKPENDKGCSVLRQEGQGLHLHGLRKGEKDKGLSACVG
jgi:hypothetical protein